MHACTCSELCAACDDDEESPFSQHRPSHQKQLSHQDSEASEQSGTQAERDTDQQWITSQLEAWERYYVI